MTRTTKPEFVCKWSEAVKNALKAYDKLHPLFSDANGCAHHDYVTLDIVKSIYGVRDINGQWYILDYNKVPELGEGDDEDKYLEQVRSIWKSLTKIERYQALGNLVGHVHFHECDSRANAALEREYE